MEVTDSDKQLLLYGINYDRKKIQRTERWILNLESRFFCFDLITLFSWQETFYQNVSVAFFV